MRKPIGLKHSEADLALEPGYRHFGVVEGADPGAVQLVACLMVVPRGDGLAQIRQMAVAPRLRGQGVGRRLMLHAEAQLAPGVSRIYVNARDHAIDFYAKCGYTPVGDRFIEVGIPHLRLEKTLAGAAAV